MINGTLQRYIPIELIKNDSEILTEQLQRLFNSCLTEGQKVPETEDGGN